MGDIKELLGLTLKRAEKVSNEYIVFETEDKKYSMSHRQDCCESVTIEDIEGELSDLVGSPILQAEAVSNHESIKPDLEYDSFTWTFYKLATIKGYVTIRWFGSSNGYYSEEVDFESV